MARAELPGPQDGQINSSRIVYGGVPSSEPGASIDARKVLSRIYGPEAIYPDLVWSGDGRGMMTVGPELVGKGNELLLDSLEGDKFKAVGRIKIQDKHATGHFAPESGLPLVLSGHKHIDLATEATGLLLTQRYGQDFAHPRIYGFERTDFSGAIKPGDEVEVVSSLTSYEEGPLTAVVNLYVDGQVKSTVTGLMVVRGDTLKERVMRPDQLIEFAAQSAATKIFESQPDARPLFGGIGTTLFSGVEARLGDRLTAITSSTGNNDPKRFEGSSRIINQEGQELAVINNMTGLILPQRTLARMLR